MKRKIVKRLFAVCLAASLTVGLVPSVGISALAAGELAEAVKTGLTIRESEIHQLLTEDLELPTSVSGLEGATVTYSVGDADASYASVSGNTLKVTRPYAGEDDYKFKLTATVLPERGWLELDGAERMRADLFDRLGLHQ